MDYDDSFLFEILVDWNYWGNFQVNLKQRPAYLSRMQAIFASRTALTILGIRRAGKSSLVHLFLQQLFSSKKLDVNDTFFVNLEDPRFAGQLKATDLHHLLELYLRNLTPKNPIVVLDEVQNVEGWERFVRYLLEAKGYRVIVTGSSSKLLNHEVSTVLTGRHVDLEVYPLSFKELLYFKGIEHATPVEIAKNKIEISRAFDEYLRWGGFPEIVQANTDERKRELLSRYFDDILFKDLVKRFSIKEVHKLERMANVFVTNIATLQSFNRLKSLLHLSLDTVERFTRYFEVSRIFFFLKKYEFSIGKLMRSIHKVYLADNGFYSVKGFRFSENVGRMAENMVAVELLKKRLQFPELELYYWRDYQQREVDFVVKQGERVRQLIQVCWNLSDPKTLKREENNLLRAWKEINCNSLLVLTQNHEEKKEYFINGEKRTIRFMPLWRWMLEE